MAVGVALSGLEDRLVVAAPHDLVSGAKQPTEALVVIALVEAGTDEFPQPLQPDNGLVQVPAAVIYLAARPLDV